MSGINTLEPRWGSSRELQRVAEVWGSHRTSASAACKRANVMATIPSSALDTLERVGTALADPTRRRILLTLAAGPAYPADMADQLGVGRSNMSNHLTCLRGCGLVRATREGRQVRYELASDRLAHALTDLVGLELEVDELHEDLDGRA